jgi:2-polyprenyl-3-methyl-5-hydroxy-6-metoxy-1,4-benzoquinol methylase
MSKNKSQFDYYKNNKSYSTFLEKGEIGYFKLYTDLIQKYKPSKNIRVLDVGCGTGIVVDWLNRKGLNATGVEVSLSSIALARKRKGTFVSYEGKKLPFQDNSFDIVGSYAVIEHVDDVAIFLSECKRVCKPGGVLIVAAPNFLSVTSSYHYRTKGVIRKLKNIYLTLIKAIKIPFGSQVVFDKFEPVIDKTFHPDDDAVNLINPIDLFRWGINGRMTCLDFIGSILPMYLSYRLGRVPIINLFTGGITMAFRKNV